MVGLHPIKKNIEHWTRSKWWYILYIAQVQALEHKPNDFKLLSTEEDLPVTENEEQKLWELRLLGCKSAISLLHPVYYYYGKLFRLRSGEHSNITVANVDVGSDFIRFNENVVKTFHGGFTDWKYEPR